MQKIKRLFVKGEPEMEIPNDVETMASEPREPRMRRPQLITPYDEVRAMVGMRPPALKLYSSDPYATMDARSREGVTIPLLPGVPYPVVWMPAEQWRPPVMSESEKSINFQIPIGRTFASMGITKRVEIEAWAIVPISKVPYGWSRLGIVGRQQINLDVVSADFSTMAELAQKRYEVEHLIRMSGEAAFIELLEGAKHMPEAQRTFAYDEMLRGLGLGGVKGLLDAKDPEAVLTKQIEELIKRRDDIRRSKR